jgi:hypothetical protein
MDFFQTVGALNAIPYEVRFRHVNPFTGLIDIGFPLSAGNVFYGSYVAGGAPTWQSTAPAQGQGHFSAVAGAIQYAASAPVDVSSTSSSITVPQLAIDSSVAAASGTLSVNVTTTTPGRFDKAELVIARYGEIVNTMAVDPAILSGSGGTIIMPNLPAGTAAMPDNAAFYYGYLRVWKTTLLGTRVHVIPIVTFADFRVQSAASLSATLP